MDCLATPGHTPDSLSLYIDGHPPSQTPPLLFSGDTLLIHGSGRTDFAGGNSEDSYDSIVSVMFKLSPETVVFPGHDYKGYQYSTIGEEQLKNTRVVGKTKQQYAELMSKLFDARNLPEKIQKVLQVNQAGLKESVQPLVQFPPLSHLSRVSQVQSLELSGRLMHDDVPPLVVDVRDDQEVARDRLGRIPESVHVPFHSLSAFSDEIKKTDSNQPIVVVCRVGIRSNSAAAILSSFGLRNVSNLQGGMLNWVELNLPTKSIT